MKKYYLFGLIAFVIVLPLILTSCTKTIKYSSGETLNILKNVDISNVNFVADIKTNNWDCTDAVVKNLVEENGDITTYMKDDIFTTIVQKIDNHYYSYIDSGDYVNKYEISQNEFLILRKDILGNVYNFEEMNYDFEYDQFEIMDYYGLLESVNLIGGKKQNNKQSFYISLPYIQNDSLYYLEGKIYFEKGKLSNYKISRMPDTDYISSAYKENLLDNMSTKEISFSYDDFTISIPNASLSTPDYYSFYYEGGVFTIDGDTSYCFETFTPGTTQLLTVDDSEYYTFDGWYFDWECKNFAGNAGDEIQIPTYVSFTLHAKSVMKEDAFVKVSINYGDAVCFNEMYSYAYVPSGSTYETAVEYLSPYNFYKEGYYFDGFYKDSNFAQEVDDVAIEEDTIVYAKFTKHAKIYVNSESVTNQLFRTYYTCKEFLYYDTIMPALEGKMFLGWYLDDDTSLESLNEEDIALMGELTVYPKFENGVTVYIDYSRLISYCLPSFIVIENDCTVEGLGTRILNMFKDEQITIYIDENLTQRLNTATSIPNKVYLFQTF